MSIVKKIIYNCKQATLLSLKKEEGKASVKERIQLWIHLCFCVFCRRFVQQSQHINHALHHLAQQQEQQPVHHLPESLKAALQEQLNASEK
jgi:hypothetical protein